MNTVVVVVFLVGLVTLAVVVAWAVAKLKDGGPGGEGGGSSSLD